MKKCALVVALIVFGASYVYGTGGNLSGDGSEANPYLIEDLADFNAFCKNESYWQSGVHTQLMCDLDLSVNGTYTQASIASGISKEETTNLIVDNKAIKKKTGEFIGDEFCGSFNGNDHVIRNLSIEGTDFCGLFGYISNGTILNLGLEKVSIKGKFVVGALAGYVEEGKILHCYASANIEGWPEQVGGLIGRAKTTNVTNCHALCNIVGSTYVGGLIGEAEEGCQVNSCYASGTIQGDGEVGGLIGEAESSEVKNCCASGTVDGGEEVGGLIGEAHGYGRKATIIANCYAISKVIGEKEVGGLIGEVYFWTNSYLQISNCYATGTVNGLSEEKDSIGGLIGDFSKTVYNGSLTPIISGCFWNVDTTGQRTTAKNYDMATGQYTKDDAGKPRTDKQMKDAQTFIEAGWDFAGEMDNGAEDIWQMGKDGYPVFSWEKDKLSGKKTKTTKASVQTNEDKLQNTGQPSNANILPLILIAVVISGAVFAGITYAVMRKKGNNS